MTTSPTGGTGGGSCVPVDDANPCTDDLWESGAPVHHPPPPGSPCSNAGVMCDGAGQCVECLAPADCPGSDDACQTRTCQLGKCGQGVTAPGTAVPVQTAGDCKKSVCDGQGAAVVENDDTDVPDDDNACTNDVCSGGVPSNPKEAPGTPCGAGLLCDAAGTCVGCTTPSDCPGSDDECQVRTCTAGACGVSFTVEDTPLAVQTPNDCLQVVRDGSGHGKTVADDTDLPLDGRQRLHRRRRAMPAWRATRPRPTAAPATTATAVHGRYLPGRRLHRRQPRALRRGYDLRRWSVRRALVHRDPRVS